MRHIYPVFRLYAREFEEFGFERGQVVSFGVVDFGGDWTLDFDDFTTKAADQKTTGDLQLR